MLSLLLAAVSLTPAFNDTSYENLAYAKPVGAGGCIAQFDNGAVEITQAFNTAERTSINVAVVTGKPNPAVRAGARLWVRSGYGPAWRALVIESTPERLRFAAHHRFVGDLFTDELMPITLHKPGESANARDAVFVNVASETAGFREKLATAFDCADAIGI